MDSAARASANRNTLPQGRPGRAGKEEGRQETGPLESWRRGQRPEVDRKRIPGCEGRGRKSDTLNSIAAGKFKVFRIGLDAKGATK